jgi:outer membrane murein-binding lipoprotein Lpp
MKTDFTPTGHRFNRARFYSLAALAAGLSAAVLAGCSKQARNDASATAKDAYADTKDAFAHGWDEVKSFTFEQQDKFAANAKALSAKMDAQVSEMRANYSDAKASASRKAAMEELKNSEADYKEKVGALGSATSATWDSAKQNVIASWDRLQASYYKARAD